MDMNEMCASSSLAKAALCETWSSEGHG